LIIDESAFYCCSTEEQGGFHGPAHQHMKDRGAMASACAL
jgi:hypothetical protein